MSSLAMARHLAAPGASAGSPAETRAGRGTGAAGSATCLAGRPDRVWQDRELDLVVSGVQRQRPVVPAAELALLTAATVAELAARHPVDGYFPVLVRVTLLGRLPER